MILIILKIKGLSLPPEEYAVFLLLLIVRIPSCSLIDIKPFTPSKPILHKFNTIIHRRKIFIDVFEFL